MRLMLSPHRQLETDDALLVPKCRGALERYGHQLVIGNILMTRKETVIFVHRDPAAPIERLNRGDLADLEDAIIARVVAMHAAMLPE